MLRNTLFEELLILSRLNNKSLEKPSQELQLSPHRGMKVDTIFCHHTAE